MVPRNFIRKTGIYRLSIDDGIVVVKLADSAAAIYDFVSHIHNTKVVGLDYITAKSFIDSSQKSSGLLVLSRADSGSRYCLVVQLDYLSSQVPESLKNLLHDPDICFVRASDVPSEYRWVYGFFGIKSIQVGELAARVLNQPDLYGARLSDIACKVGVPSLEFNESGQIQVEQNYTRVLTPEQVKKAVVNAYACAKIGVKLLC